jgi:hypothetical protein
VFAKSNHRNVAAGNIDEEIAIIEASLQSIIDRKRDQEFSAEQDQQRLESTRTAIAATIDRIHAVVAMGRSGYASRAA